MEEAYSCVGGVVLGVGIRMGRGVVTSHSGLLLADSSVARVDSLLSHDFD